MSETITLHGHPVSKGVAEGEALVCDKPMSFIAAGVSNEEGIVRIDRNDAEFRIGILFSQPHTDQPVRHTFVPPVFRHLREFSASVEIADRLKITHVSRRDASAVGVLGQEENVPPGNRHISSKSADNARSNRPRYSVARLVLMPPRMLVNTSPE